jgi:NAD(P)H-dependent FMN reductase
MLIFAISGSLRRQSVSGRILDALAERAPADVGFDRYEGLREIPAFDPDVADDAAPVAVADLRARVAAADAVLISSPEYAMGPPGALKNLLDWLVGSGELYGKPVILAHPTNRALVAKAALEGTLGIMGAELVAEAYVPIDLAEFAEGATAPRPAFEAATDTAFAHLRARLAAIAV